MNGFYAILKKELLEAVRSKKLIILFSIFAFLALASPISAKLLPIILKSMPATPGLTITIPDPTWRDAIDQFVKNLTQLVALVLIFLFAGAITEERSKKTLEMVISKPISRTSFVLAKFIANAIALKNFFILSALTFYLYTKSIFGDFSLPNFIWLCLFLLIFLILIQTSTIFLSTVSGNQIIAVGVSFLLFILFSTLFEYIKPLSSYSPSFVLGHYKDLMETGQIANFLRPAFASLSLSIFFIAWALTYFKKQEIER